MVIVVSCGLHFLHLCSLLGTIKKYSLLFVSLSGCFMCFIFQTLFLIASVYRALGCHIFETIPGFGVVCKAAGTHR